MLKDIDSAIRTIPDFPKKGIMFRDITTAIKQPEIYKEIIDFFVEKLKDVDFDYIVAMESRGFIFGAPLAYAMNKGLVVVRKPGKLPAETYSAEYQLEYGTDTLEMHKDAIEKGKKAVIIDDLLATGGTLGATKELVEKAGGYVSAAAFLIELDGLNGRENHKDIDIIAMLKI